MLPEETSVNYQKKCRDPTKGWSAGGGERGRLRRSRRRLIAPMIVRDESSTRVAQVDVGECYANDRITLVIEQDDLS